MQIRLINGETCTFSYGDIIFKETNILENADTNNELKILGKQSVINDSTLIPEAAGYTFWVEVKSLLTILEFDMGFSQYGIHADEILVKKITEIHPLKASI